MTATFRLPFFPFALILGVLLFAPLPSLWSKVISGIIDVKQKPDLLYFGYGYKKIAVPDLNFTAPPSITVYVKNTIVTGKGYWVELTDPRALLMVEGGLFIAYQVADGRPILDGDYRIVVFPQVVHSADQIFFKAGAATTGEIIGAFVAPRAMTLKAVKIQILNPSATAPTSIKVLKSAGNNTPTVEVMDSDLTVLPANFTAPDKTTFTATNNRFSANDVVQVTVSSATPATLNILVTLVAEFDN